jgi:diguanylate cyclase (GGDEF)-like protein
VVSNTDRAGARVVAEKLRERIAGATIVFDNKQIPVTISLGSASFSEQFTRNINWDTATKDLINHADIALYFAKANGRNQSCQYETLPDNTVKTFLKTG